jgi:hypothetical protein
MSTTEKQSGNIYDSTTLFTERDLMVNAMCELRII